MKRQGGLTLIEVLVAVVILAIGLLGIAGLQSSALSNNSLGYQYTQAAVLAQSMAERMRANASAISQYSLTAGTTSLTVNTNCSTTACSPNDQAAWDLAVWLGAIRGQSLSSKAPVLTLSDSSNHPFPLLGSGTASIACADASCTDRSLRIITVYWDGTRTADSSDSSYYSCDPSKSKALRCYSLVYAPS